MKRLLILYPCSTQYNTKKGAVISQPQHLEIKIDID